MEAAVATELFEGFGGIAELEHMGQAEVEWIWRGGEGETGRKERRRTRRRGRRRAMERVSWDVSACTWEVRVGEIALWALGRGGRGSAKPVGLIRERWRVWPCTGMSIVVGRGRLR